MIGNKINLLNMKTVLITGGTGFLGSHIIEELLSQKYEVIALKRSSSNLSRCMNFVDKVRWICCDNIEDAEQEILNSHANLLIHAAWNGVKASDRDNWVEQEKNLSFLSALLEIVKKANITKIIALGSQAEYGNFEGVIDETHNCNPNSAYGANKVCASTIIKSFAEQNNISWYWIRIFSVYGPREERNWLIPATINNLLNLETMNLTPCEQRYDYLYTKDFANGILSVVNDGASKSGIYNMSSGQSIKIKDILTYIENKIAPKKNLLKIGALPYRLNQVMYMEGNSDKFFKAFNFIPTYNITQGLDETINYYK